MWLIVFSKVCVKQNSHSEYYKNSGPQYYVKHCAKVAPMRQALEATKKLKENIPK